MSILAKKFPDAAEGRDSDKFNSVGLPRILDEQHMQRALDSDDPHEYISQRAGRMEFNGEDAIGFFNAVTLHKEVIDCIGYCDSLKDTTSASLRAALRDLGKIKELDHYNF